MHVVALRGLSLEMCIPWEWAWDSHGNESTNMPTMGMGMATLSRVPEFRSVDLHWRTWVHDMASLMSPVSYQIVLIG